MDLYQKIIANSRYARFIPELKRRETWEETVDRLISFIKANSPELNSELPRLKKAITNLEVMPSMRLMMSAGEACKRDNIAAYNCSYLAVNNKRAFSECLYILMNGTGVGFSCERQDINKLPEIPHDISTCKDVIVVGDSKLGWAKAFKKLLSSLWEGDIPTIDYSQVRPAGARLKIFGGRASGPEPLKRLFHFVIDTFVEAKGRKLNSIEVHDIMCMIGEIVVVGGVRRSALISLSNLTDRRMREAKIGAWYNDYPWRGLANNSVAYTEKPDVETFMEEWLSLVKSKSGERGIFNRIAAQKQAAKWNRRDGELSYGTNPCSEIILRDKEFCVSPNTPLITKENGIQPISSFADRQVSIWNGEEWTPVTVRKTGSNQKLMRVYLNDGSYLDCTPDHRWSVKDRFSEEWKEVETKDLMDVSKYSLQVEPCNTIAPVGGVNVDSAYTMGFAVGDGCVYKNKTLIDLYGIKDLICPVEGIRHKKRLNHTGTCEYVRCNATEFAKPDLILTLKENGGAWTELLGSWNKESVMSFVAGLADADGSETGTGGIRICINSYEKGRALQLLLAKFGVRCSINLHQKEGTLTNFGVRKRDSWYVQITNCADIPCHRLDVSEGHEPKFKGKYQNIMRVEELEGLHDTYCFNEPKRHKGMFGNVLTYQCNLTEVVVRANDTEKTLKNKIELATILGTFQSTLTNFQFLSSEWKKNTEEERLLGVSLTGIMDAKITSNPDPKMLERLRDYARETNEIYAKKLGIPRSAAITCVKPSGTVSQLVDSASGIHARHNSYYIRRIRMDKKDPIYNFLRDKGVQVEDEQFRPDSTAVFSFPVKAPKGAVLRNDMTAIEQLENWLIYQRHWCEHKPSVTISVKDDEWVEVGAWVWKYFDEISGVSFLPYSDHTYIQSPYEDCDENQYNALKKITPVDLDFTEFIENDDNTTSAQTLACTGGTCEI